jgi:hypothetical protein
MPESKRHPVKEIQSLVLGVLKSNPPHLLISAHGMVTSTGWGNPALVPRGEVTAEGLLELDYVVSALPVTLAQVNLPVHAAYLFEGDLARVRQVRVHAEANALEQPVSGARPVNAADTILGLGPEPPRARPVSVTSLPQTLRDLVGFRPRVIRAGEPVGEDHDAKRINFHLDEAGTINKITVG